jgi:hypothetical protein
MIDGYMVVIPKRWRGTNEPIRSRGPRIESQQYSPLSGNAVRSPLRFLIWMKRFAMKLMVPRGENDDLVDRGIRRGGNRREGSESESENKNIWHVTYPSTFTS